MRVVVDEGVNLPTKAHKTDAGYDIYSLKNKIIFPHSSAVFDTGVHIELPPNTVGMLKSKSGLNINHDLISEGVIDVGYTGSIRVKLYNLGRKFYRVKAGDKISQLVVLPLADIGELEVVDKLEETDRGSNGFGSSGK